MRVVNGYTINEFKQKTPWSVQEEANWELAFTLMPVNGTTMIGSTGTEEHLHYSLYNPSGTLRQVYVDSSGIVRLYDEAGEQHVQIEDGLNSGSNVLIATSLKARDALRLYHSNAVWNAAADGALLALECTIPAQNKYAPIYAAPDGTPGHEVPVAQNIWVRVRLTSGGGTTPCWIRLYQ